MKIPPRHPALDGALGIQLELDGLAVKAADIEVGFHHHGLEKLFESATYDEGVEIAGRVHGGHSRVHQASPTALGYVIACEELLAVVPPRRAQVLRVILAEMTRLGEHLGTLRLEAHGAGAASLASSLARRQRLVDDALAEIARDRGDAPLVRIGGLRGDIPESALDPLAGILKDFPEFLARLADGSLLRKLFAMRLRGTGTVTREEAIASGFTGPSLRASGVDHDIRRARPYCGYERYDFTTPTQAGGDSWARFVQRAEECRESLRIVAQARDDLRPGAIDLEPGVLESAIPPESRVPQEGMANEEQGVSGPLPGDEIYSSTEAPSGELGYLLVAGDPLRPYRVRMRAPSFYHAAALSGILAREKLADVPLVVASFALVAGEIDR